MNHRYKQCSGTPECHGCRAEGQDCLYEVLSICKICGGMEGSLLPECPGVMQTPEQDKQNYADYCAGTGPFVGQGR